MSTLIYFADIPGIEITQFSDEHMRIKHLRDGAEMDFWPHTGKAHWLNMTQNIYFTIQNLDAYLEDKFVPKWWQKWPFKYQGKETAPRLG